MQIIFFGTPEFAVPALEALVNAGYDVVSVVTQPDKPVGRGLKMEAPAVKLAAQKLGLTVLQPDTLNVVARGLACPAPSPALMRRVPRSDAAHKMPRYAIELKILNPDLGVCVAYGKIIPKEILDLFPRGILNIHPSLLPKYRGPSPIQTAIRNGDEETGVTIMLLDEEMDHGPILEQTFVHLDSSELCPTGHNSLHAPYPPTGNSITRFLAIKGAELLVETLPKYLAGKIKPRAQDHAKATFTKMLEREDGRIDWRKPADQIERIIRAYDMWPGTFTMWGAKRLKILRTSLLHSAIGCANNATPGYVWRTDDGRLAVNCNPGSIIIETLQLEGKKEMRGEEFLRGSPKFLGTVLK